MRWLARLTARAEQVMGDWVASRVAADLCRACTKRSRLQ
jgi:hypothetical protein